MTKIFSTKMRKIDNFGNKSIDLYGKGDRCKLL